MYKNLRRFMTSDSPAAYWSLACVIIMIYDMHITNFFVGQQDDACVNVSKTEVILLLKGHSENFQSVVV